MRTCQECNVDLETWEVACRKCGKLLYPQDMPTVEQALSSDASLEEAFKQWLERGKGELSGERYEEAAACLQEALRRLRGLDSGPEAESEVRPHLRFFPDYNQRIAVLYITVISTVNRYGIDAGFDAKTQFAVF